MLQRHLLFHVWGICFIMSRCCVHFTCSSLCLSGNGSSLIPADNAYENSARGVGLTIRGWATVSNYDYELSAKYAMLLQCVQCTRTTTCGLHMCVACFAY